MKPESYPLTLVVKEVSNLAYYWCSDGWVYIPEINTRRKYLATSIPDQFDIIEEKWEGLIPVSEYSELLEVSLYSEYPRIWKEESEDFCELYVETIKTPSKSKKSTDHQQTQ